MCCAAWSHLQLTTWLLLIVLLVMRTFKGLIDGEGYNKKSLEDIMLV